MVCPVKSLQERAAARKAIYQAYANVGSQESLSINQIGIPKVRQEPQGQRMHLLKMIVPAG